MSAIAGSAPEERKRSFQRRAKKALRRALMALGLRTIPYLYVAYMRLVYRTSRVEELGPNLAIARRELGRGVYAIWHDEVFFVAYAFGKYHPDTLASQGDSGSIIARMLEVCGYRVFRGGSSSGDQRRSAAIVRDMIALMKSEPGVIYGITTDGSKGPVYRMKKGAVHIAAKAGAPVFVLKTWCRRYVRLPTWDRTLLPLPFNHIVHVYKGPIPLRADLPEAERFEALCRDTERALCQVTAYARARTEGLPLPRRWLALFPEEFRAEMARGEEPAPLFMSTGADAVGR
jgi:lysophospholipid acyltransferase (LPLAT)-like uncharacterized protein